MKMQKIAIFVKKKLKVNIWKIKHIVKLEIIVIIQGNVLRIAYVNLNIRCLKTFVQIFIMDLTMIIILSKELAKRN